MTSHAKTVLTVSVRTVERTASERIRNGSKNRSKRLHLTAERRFDRSTVIFKLEFMNKNSAYIQFLKQWNEGES